MFTPEELEFMPREIEKLFTDLEWRIMMDVVRRLQAAGEITRTADWQIHRLSELGKSKAEIKKFIKEIMSMTDKEIDRIYEETIATGYVRDKRLYEAMGKDFIPYAENMVLQQMVKAIKEQTKEQLQNITQSMGFAKVVDGKVEFLEIADFYQKTLDNAVMDIASGAFDYNSVLKRTIDTMTHSGLRTVDYASGWHNRMEVAARRALMTGLSQVTGRINEQNAEKLGTEWFEVTRHVGARPDHQPWQGKVFNLEQLRTICGYGEVTGLKGANCYHDFDPFIPGIDERKYTDEELERLNAEENTPKEWNGKQYTAYEATQKQRRMERTIRSQRDKINLLEEGEADADTITAAKCRWRKKMSDYADFSDAMGLPQQRERFYIGKAVKKNKGLAAGKSSASGIPEHDSPKLLKNIKFSDRQAVMQEVTEFEAGAVKKNIETACVITKDGEVYQCFGIKDRVFVDSDLKEKLQGAIISHNHPISETTFTFSDDDISLFQKYNLEILRGCDEKYTYELTRDKSQIDEMLIDWTTEENYWHCAMIRNALQYGFGYRRWKNE